jgi:hypothetical protein
MVCFQTKPPVSIHMGGPSNEKFCLVHIMTTSIVCGHLLSFIAIWYMYTVAISYIYYPHFGILYQRNLATLTLPGFQRRSFLQAESTASETVRLCREQHDGSSLKFQHEQIEQNYIYKLLGLHIESLLPFLLYML